MDSCVFGVVRNTFWSPDVDDLRLGAGPILQSTQTHFRERPESIVSKILSDECYPKYGNACDFLENEKS